MQPLDSSRHSMSWSNMKAVSPMAWKCQLTQHIHGRRDSRLLPMAIPQGPIESVAADIASIFVPTARFLVEFTRV